MILRIEGGEMKNAWQKVRLGDICEITTGKTNRQDATEDGIYPLFDRSISIKRSDKYLFDGEATIVPGEGKEFVPRYYHGKFDLHQRVYALFPNESVSGRFIYYAVLNGRKHFEQIAVGSTVKSLRLASFKIMKIPLPPLPAQRAIAATLSCLDDKIELNKRVNANFEAQAQAIFKNWFVDFEPFKGGGFVDGELGRIPKGWKTGKLKDLCIYSNTKIAVHDLDALTYISTENMLSNKAGYMKAATLPAITQTLEFLSGDVLISNIRPYFKKIVYCNSNGGCSTDVLCFRPINQIFSVFLYCSLYDDFFFDYMVAGSKGTKMPRGDKQHIMNYPIIIPTDKEFIRFTDLVTPLMAMKYALAKQSRAIAAIRDALLLRLMSGELEVKVE
jgi:type I restriction enzyme S subunit